jgi:indole-3-glycerol phosphate synthase
MINSILHQILDSKRKSVAQLRADPSSRGFRDRALEIRKKADPHRLLRALESDPQRINVIAEFKRRSPSAGIIRDDFAVSEIVRCYERGGACAVSVLTDREYFGGSTVDLNVARSSTSLPLLRKDFIIDPIQIFEAAVAGADAVLLIAAALDDVSLGQLRTLAEDELGLDTLVEVHTSGELSRAVNAGASLIGVNNRDLSTFQVSLNTSERLIAEAPKNKILVSESGLHAADSLLRLRKHGFRGFLVGEVLMRAADPEMALRDLISRSQDSSPTQLAIRASQQ